VEQTPPTSSLKCIRSLILNKLTMVANIRSHKEMKQKVKDKWIDLGSRSQAPLRQLPSHTLLTPMTKARVKSLAR
jgi:hypothetical protein